MGISVANEVYIFFVMVLLGAACVFLFDLFRIMRKLIKMSTAWVAVTDFVFWIIFSVVIVGGILYFNNGSLRWYEFIGMVLGVIIYLGILSRPIMFVFIKIIDLFAKFIGYILKILLTPLIFLYKILVRPIIAVVGVGLKSIAGFCTSFGGRAGKLICSGKERVSIVAERGNRRNKKVKAKKKRSLIPWLVFGVICAMFINAMIQQPKILENKEKIASLEEQIAYEQLRAKEVDALKDMVNTDEYIERMARDRLGLIKENEKVFIDVAG